MQQFCDFCGPWFGVGGTALSTPIGQLVFKQHAANAKDAAQDGIAHEQMEKVLCVDAVAATVSICIVGLVVVIALIQAMKHWTQQQGHLSCSKTNRQERRWLQVVAREKGSSLKEDNGWHFVVKRLGSMHAKEPWRKDFRDAAEIHGTTASWSWRFAASDAAPPSFRELSTVTIHIWLTPVRHRSLLRRSARYKLRNDCPKGSGCEMFSCL